MDKEKRVLIDSIMNKKMDEMYEDNKISTSDYGQIRMYDDGIFETCYDADSTEFKDFDTFLYEEIMRSGSFCDNDKYELDFDEHAQEVLNNLFHRTADKQ